MADDRHSKCVNDLLCDLLLVVEHYVGQDLLGNAVEVISVDNPTQKNIKNI